MDVSTFYALFAATCFTLVGLWWGVVQRDLSWTQDPVRRRAVGGVYLTFLLPALMGLFAQVGAADSPGVWRISFVAIAAVGVVSSVRVLTDDADRRATAARAGVTALYAGIALVAAFPALADLVNLSPIQAAALLLVMLVALGHALVWRFLVHEVQHQA